MRRAPPRGPGAGATSGGASGAGAAQAGETPGVVSSAPRPALVVRVKFMTRRQLKLAWLRELSKNTLFVRTDTPLPVAERVVIVLELPDGEQVQIEGQIVATVQPAGATAQRPAGMTVQLTGLDKRARIEDYLRRNRTQVNEVQPAMETLVRSVRRILWLAGDAEILIEVDHYQILGLSPTADTAEIKEACSILRVLLDPLTPPEGLADRLTASQRERVEALYNTVGQIERTLTDPDLRARYDAAVFSIVR